VKDEVPKVPRMKTNKVRSNVRCFVLKLTLLGNFQRKAENFYTNANVKNKNRQKAQVMKTLTSGKKGGRRR
jgi:hypothetical protein